jgi:hypothetical protein
MADFSIGLFTEEYKDNLDALSQQMKPTVAMDGHCRKYSATGAQATRILSQVGETAARRRTTGAQPAQNVEMTHDGRWAFPDWYDWGTVIDNFDQIRTNIAPGAAYISSALAAHNRQKDQLFLEAFFGTNKTGASGATSTPFDSNNVVDVDVGGGGVATGLNVEKIRAARKGLKQNHVDLRIERPKIGFSAEQEDDLMALTYVTNADFNGGRKPVLQDGNIYDFLGFDFIQCEYLPTDTDDYRRLPVWVPSGMACASWVPLKAEIRNRPDLQGNPLYAEASFCEGYTRTEEAKCFEIKCAE